MESRKDRLIEEIRFNILQHLKTNMETEWQYRWGLELGNAVNYEVEEDLQLADAVEAWIRAHVRNDWDRIRGADRLLNPGAWGNDEQEDE